MAPIEVKCLDCGKSIKVKHEFAGKKGKCPVCGKVITIPDPSKLAANSYEFNIDVGDDEVKKVAQQIADGPSLKVEKKKGFLSKIFGRK